MLVQDGSYTFRTLCSAKNSTTVLGANKTLTPKSDQTPTIVSKTLTSAHLLKEGIVLGFFLEILDPQTKRCGGLNLGQFGSGYGAYGLLG